MAPPKPSLSEDEVDDLVYLARTGEDAELAEMLRELAGREGATPAEVLEAARDDGQATCLHMAAANGHAKTVTYILSLLPVKPSSSSTPTPTTAKSASTSIPPQTSPESAAQRQQRSGGEEVEETEPDPAYLDARNSFGNTALHWACLGGHLDVVQLLLSRGARPAAANDKDQIPLDLAAFNGHMHVVEHFLAQSRDIEGDNAEEGVVEGVKDVEMGEGEGGGA